MTIFDTPIQQEQIQIPDYAAGRIKAAEFKQNQQINQLNIQKFQEERIKSQRENEKAIAANKLSQLSLGSDPQLASQALSQLAAVDPDRAKKNVEYLYDRSAAASSYATTALLAPREIKAKVYKHIIKEARNDPRIDQQALAEFPDEYTPDLDAKLYAVAQSHRKLEDGLKAHQEAATLANTEAKTKTEGFQQANFASEIKKRKVETENARIGRGEKAPPGYRYKPDGNLEKIPGGPAEKSSGEAAKISTIAAGGITAVNDLKNVLVKNKNDINSLAAKTKLPNTLQGNDVQKFNVLRTDLGDLIGRLRSGGQISPTEQETYKGLIPAFGDSKPTQEYKLKRLGEIFTGLDEKIKGQSDSSNNAGGDPLGLFNNA